MRHHAPLLNAPGLCLLASACCRLSDVFHVQGNPQSSEALIRACADTAATAVVLLPWSQPAAAADVGDLVAAGMVDAAVLSVVRRLRALNPSVQVRPAAAAVSGLWNTRVGGTGLLAVRLGRCTC